MKLKSLLSALLLGSCIIPAMTQSAPVSISVEKMPDQPLPVTVSTARLESFQYTSQLSAEYAAEKGTKPEKISLMLVLFRDGKVLSGEGWEETAPSGSIFRETKLGIEPGDRAILVVNSVTADHRTWKLNARELGEQIHALAEGRSPLSIPVEVSSVVGVAPKLVRAQGQSGRDAALQSAVTTCGAGQVQSFSCNPTTGQYSFTCKVPKPVQP